MPIISVEIIKTTDEREMQKITKERQTKTEKSKGNRSYSERVRASFIFKSNLELTLPIILKQKELFESKHIAVECRCLKI